MKKVLLSILLTLLPLLASAETVEIDGIWYNIVPKAKVAEVTKNPNIDLYYLGSYSGSIEIPPSVIYNKMEYSVTSIGDRAFYYCGSLTSVTIPNSVTSIGDQAFFCCSSLTSITIPNSVTTIGNGVFDGCDGLTSVIIPNSVTSMGDFGGCKGLKSVILSNNLKRIGGFKNCIALTSVTIPNGVLSIGTMAFENCAALSSVSIPNSVTLIDEEAFCDCSGLTSVTIPNSVTSIGSFAFAGCKGLTSVTIGNSVTSIGNSGFSGCSGLTSITIPNNVTYISERTFANCSGLNSVTIGSGVKFIGEQAFANCDDLMDVCCLAERLRGENWYGEGLYTYTDAFQDSYPQAMTLHVPAASIEAYSATEPWSNFNAIVPLEDGEIPVIQKCATPEISYENGKVKFTCETEGVDFISEVTVDDAKKYYDSEFTLSQTYKITVYATKAGYENSDVATREIVIENGQSSLFGDLNKDGKVNVADHVKLSDIIMNQE